MTMANATAFRQRDSGNHRCLDLAGFLVEETGKRDFQISR